MIFETRSEIILKQNLTKKPIYNNKYWETKIKPYGDETTDFLVKEMPKADSHYICPAVILISFVRKKDENYYLQVF